MLQCTSTVVLLVPDADSTKCTFVSARVAREWFKGMSVSHAAKRDVMLSSLLSCAATRTGAVRVRRVPPQDEPKNS